MLNDLKSSIQDIGDYAYKFPFIKEILDITYEASGEADYIIFSNPDIALMPYFYNTIKAYVDQGHDSIIVNRRSITDKYTSIENIPLMWAEVGEKHPGWDCFVFKREMYPKFRLKKGVIGAVGSGRILHSNLRFNSQNYVELKNADLTFHIGLSPTSTRQYIEKNWIKVNLHNDDQLQEILEEMIGSVNDGRVAWANNRLKIISIRKKKYHAGLYGVKRFRGYWFLKKIKALFNKVT